MTQHDDITLGRCEQPSQRRGRPEDVEEPGRRATGEHLERAVARADVGGVGELRLHRLEGAGLLPERGERGPGQAPIVRPADPSAVLGDVDEAIGVGPRDWRQQGRVDDLEERCRNRDTERESRGGDDREARPTHEAAGRLSELEQGRKPKDAPARFRRAGQGVGQHVQPEARLSGRTPIAPLAQLLAPEGDELLTVLGPEGARPKAQQEAPACAATAHQCMALLRPSRSRARPTFTSCSSRFSSASSADWPLSVIA